MVRNATREAVLARLGRALADPTRCRILLALLDGLDHPGEMAEALALSRSRVSNHLSLLRECGLVVTEHEGRQVRYSPAEPALAEALDELLHVALAAEAR